MPSPNYPQYLMPYVQYPYPQPQPQPVMQQQQAQQPQQSQQSFQNAGFIMVRSEEEAYRYPVAAGNCMTFKVENEPIVIEKAMSFSQLDAPKIDRYRLVKEEIVEAPKTLEEVEADNSISDELRDELQAIRRDIEGIKKKLYAPTKPVAKKREDNDDE